MRTPIRAAAVVLATCAPARAQASSEALTCVQKIALPGVNGRIDHLAVDVERKRLFLAALGNGTLEVVDLAAGKALPRGATLAGLKEPQGVALANGGRHVAFSTGEDGRLHVLDAEKLEPLALLGGGNDADNLRIDAKSDRLFVGCEEGLVVVDTQKWKLQSLIKLAGHAESFQLEPNGARLFVNVPGARHVAVVDRAAGKVVATWPIEKASQNFPMALDPDGARLYVGCRQPPTLLVLDTQSGKPVASLDCGGDCDDLFFDAARKRLYASCGEGCVAIFEVRDADHCEPLARIPTAVGARTSLFVPELGRLFLAVPHRAAQEAEVWVLDAAPPSGR